MLLLLGLTAWRARGYGTRTRREGCARGVSWPALRGRRTAREIQEPADVGWLVALFMVARPSATAWTTRSQRQATSSRSISGECRSAFPLFQTTTEQEGIDNLTFDEVDVGTAVPEPASLMLLGAGLLLTVLGGDG